MRFLSQRDLQHVWNQMCFTAVIFPELFRCTGGIEVTKRHKPEPVNGVIPAENFLEGQFRLAIGIDRALRRFFIDRQTFRRTEGRAGGGENE